MRRLLLLLVLLASCAGLLVPAQAAVYAGESLVAAAAVRVRGTDGVLYQVEVQVAQHEVPNGAPEHLLRARLAICNENGCFGSWYPLEVKASDVQFTAETASVRGVFAGSPFDVQWKARRAKKELDPLTSTPDAEIEEGNLFVSAHKDVRSAPAVVHLPGLFCKTAASTMSNQYGAVVTRDQAGEQQPAKLPSGFFPTSRRKPRCF